MHILLVPNLYVQPARYTRKRATRKTHFKDSVRLIAHFYSLSEYDKPHKNFIMQLVEQETTICKNHSVFILLRLCPNYFSAARKHFLLIN